jgi:vacuolar-type H+-ATPase subunit E/Vma4
MAEEILNKARSEAARIESDAEEKGAKILAEAKDKRKDALERAKNEAEAVAANEKNEKIAAAHLEAKRIVSHAKEGAIAASLSEVLEGTKLSREKDYKQLLKELIAQGVAEIGKDAIVKTNKGDQKLAHSLGFKVDEDAVDCIGGAVISSPDGKVVFNNTFEAKFLLSKERLRTLANDRLFGK